MKNLGISIKKNEIWYSLVEGTKMEDAKIIETGKQIFRSDSLVQTLMQDFSNITTELIARYNPNKIVYKLHLESNLKQIHYMHYSLGVLNLICHQKGIETIEHSNKWITAGKRVKINKFDSYFDSNKFKKEEMEASLLAWFELER